MAQAIPVNSLLIICLILFGISSLCISASNGQLQTEPPLMLTPLIDAAKIKEAQEASRVIQIKEMENITSFSGYLTVNAIHNASMFFWFFPAQNDSENAPVVLWLQGGPGRSSMRGLFIENGPFYIENGSLKKRCATWTQDHSVIYLDNPVGAGFSHTNIMGFPTNLTSVAEDVYQVISQFFILFPALRKNDFYIAGQSYGGKYVATIAQTIHKKNSEVKQKINLAGIAIGNGLVDPETQIKYSDFLYHIGLINSKGKIKMEAVEKQMAQHVKNQKWKDAFRSYNEIMLSDAESLYQDLTGYQNAFNLLESTSTSDKEIDMSSFVTHPAIRRAIHVGDQKFNAYNSFIQTILSDDIVKSVAPVVSELVDNYRVLIYNGQMDVLIPYRTTVDYLKKLTFKGVEEYDDAERQHWYVNNTLAGYVTQVQNLTEVMVRNAGHSVTEDQIVWATDMMYRFTRNLSFKEIQNGTDPV